MANLKKLTQEIPERLSGGHRLCAGCGASIVVRQVLMGTKDPVVVGASTGCLEVATTIYPYTAWKIPFIHNAFENVAATISGVETAYRALKKKGKIDKDIRFIAFGGDGGTYDIGLQSLSGAMERGHNMTYICYDNEAYMNTGIQRSGATPRGASTMTAQAGKVSTGKAESKKDLTAIIAAHGVPYVAQASPHRARDLMQKVQKAVATEGPCFICVLAPCPRGWRFKPEDTVAMCRLAADTCVWPLHEIEDGKVKINYKPKEKKPAREWLESQGRFKHLLTGKHEDVIEQVQQDVDRKWQSLLKREELGL